MTFHNVFIKIREVGGETQEATVQSSVLEWGSGDSSQTRGVLSQDHHPWAKVNDCPSARAVLRD